MDMAAHLEFRAFMARIGLNEMTTDAVREQGVENMVTLSELTIKDIRYLAKNVMQYQAPLVAPGEVRLPFTAVKKLEAARYWIDTRKWTGQPWRAHDLDNGELSQAMSRIQQKDERVTAGKDADVTKPEKLSNLKHWQAFWEKWENYMKQVYGSADIPLNYIYREHDAVTPEIRAEAYGTDEEERMATTVLATNHFNLDNKRVWNEFKPLIVDGPGWPFIKTYEKTSNGRGAVRDLWSQNQGENSRMIRKQKAYARLQTLRFQGPRKSWTFAQYIKEHQTQHNELDDCKEPVPESKKVTDFLAGITDTSLGNGLSFVYGNPNLLTNFDACQKYLQTIAASTRIHQMLAKGKERDIGAVGGEGAGKGRGKRGGKPVRHREYISPDKWKKLSREERSAVFQKREKDDANGKGYQKREKKPDKEKEKGRNTSSTNTADEKTDSADETEEDEHAGSAGRQFGRAAHGKEKGKKKTQ
jgi:hypothetical protein